MMTKVYTWLYRFGLKETSPNTLMEQILWLYQDNSSGYDFKSNQTGLVNLQPHICLYIGYI